MIWLTNALETFELAKLLAGPYDRRGARSAVSAKQGAQMLNTGPKQYFECIQDALSNRNML